MNTLEKSLAIIEKRNKENTNTRDHHSYLRGIVNNALSPYCGYKNIYLQICPTEDETTYSLIKGTEVILQVFISGLSSVNIRYKDMGHPVSKLFVSYFFARTNNSTALINCFEDDIAKLMVRYL